MYDNLTEMIQGHHNKLILTQRCTSTFFHCDHHLSIRIKLWHYFLLVYKGFRV